MRFKTAVLEVFLAALTPLLEKKVTKTVALDAPVVFSMSRVILLAFAVAMVRQVWHSGIAGWPDAAVAIAIVLAIPVFGALEHVGADDVMLLADLLACRLDEKN